MSAAPFSPVTDSGGGAPEPTVTRGTLSSQVQVNVTLSYAGS
jgi:hypothetical protein